MLHRSPPKGGRDGQQLERPGDPMDRLAIRELIENWAVWRDAGDWDRFATEWIRWGRS